MQAVIVKRPRISSDMHAYAKTIYRRILYFNFNPLLCITTDHRVGGIWLTTPSVLSRVATPSIEPARGIFVIHKTIISAGVDK